MKITDFVTELECCCAAVIRWRRSRVKAPGEPYFLAMPLNMYVEIAFRIIGGKNNEAQARNREATVGECGSLHILSSEIEVYARNFINPSVLASY